MQQTIDLSILLPENANNTLLEQGIAQLQEYQAMRQLYNGAIREITTKLENLDDEFSTRYAHNPIHHMESRLKSLKSIVGKLHRKGLPLTLASAQAELYDIAGVRVICNYIDDIYDLANMLCSQADVEVLQRRDYIQKPKPNGYRSLHITVRIPVFLSTGSVGVPVEIQIRTIAMDCWASLEHQLRYKAEHTVPPTLRAQLKACAEESAALDLRMQAIYRQLPKEG